MKRLFAAGRALCVAAVLIGSAGGVSAQAADPVAVVTAFGEALNAGDGATALGLFADDAVVRTPGGSVYTG